jgi:hypothetical protein
MGMRRVDVQVGVSYRPVQPKLPATCCVVGIAPEGLAPVGQTYHYAKVRSTRNSGVDQIRLNATDDLSGLPGLNSRPPSKIRDTVRLAFAAGAEMVDVVLARIPGLQPWDLHEEEARENLDAFLFDQLGAMVVMPDAGGPPLLTPFASAQTGERWNRIRKTIRRWEESWRERYQIGAFDCPDDRLDSIHQILDETQGGDFLLCGWRGTDLRLRSHGWRSAAGLASGILARKGTGVIQGIEGRVVNLGPGRRIHGNRRLLLGGIDAMASSDTVDEFCVLMDIHPERDRARVRTELTCRRPFRGWPIPAVRTVKAIHYMIREAASHFVFTQVNSMNAFNLSNSLQAVLRPFTSNGMLVGPGGEGPPKIRGSFDRNRDSPSLIADVTAQLQPWCRQIKVNVSLQQGLEPKIEMEI